jgi:thioesterase domain-containing protein
MTNDIFASCAAKDHKHVVQFRTGESGSPLFCFPGAGGNSYIFTEIIAALPEGQPVYAIDMEWLCDTKQEFSIEQVAAFCLDRIRGIQKSGPYYLCGYSFGGLVAYEIALRLIGEGDSARLVALLDAPNPALASNLSKADAAQFRQAYIIDRLKKYGLQLVRGDIKAFIGRGLAFVTSRSGALFMPAIKTAFRMMNKPLPRRLRANDPGFLKAWSSYVPRRYPKSVVCFRAEDRGPEHDRDPSMGWEACVMGGVQVHVVRGSHVDMMSTPSVVRGVADKLATYLDSGSSHKKESVAGNS